MSARKDGFYLAAPGAVLRLRAGAEAHTLAQVLWEERSPEPESLFELSLETIEGPPVPGDLEERLNWTLFPGRFRLEAEGHLSVETDVSSRKVSGRLSSALLAERPELASRLALETPIAILLSRHGYAALHAGAVCAGSRGIVIRGASGAGKSTLVAALWQKGLRVLGDESVLVSRERPSELMASVRELTVLPDTYERLGLGSAALPAWSGGERKFRIELSRRARPEDRRAVHVMTVLLGTREPGPARLVPLSPREFLDAWGEGAVKEEAEVESLSGLLADWTTRPVFRLRGGDDLPGAVRELQQLLENP